MKLNIKNEYEQLKSLAYCSAIYAHDASSYITEDPEFHKFHSLERGWDNQKMIKQQGQFLELLDRYNVELIEIKAKENLPWQMYTRDVGFVLGEKLFFNNNRKFTERRGEFDQLHVKLNELKLEHNNIVEIVSGQIEGGDVIPTEDEVLVGHSSRTSQEAIDDLAQYCNVKQLELGDQVMHLDTRFMILSSKLAVIHAESFNDSDLQYLASRFELIKVNEQEAKALATNVILINPETVVVESQQQRLQSELKQRGYKVETIDYSEPIAYGGSFRCTTMSLNRLN